MRLLILGSKEYPLGTSDDKIKSGGMEVYTQNFVEYAKERFKEIIIITRKFKNTESFEKKDNVVIHRVRWISGFYLRNPTFNFFSFLKALKLEYDVILAQGIISTLFGIALSKIKNKKIISRPAGIAYVQPQYFFLIKFLLRTLEKFAYSHVQAVVFLSKNEKEEFERKLGFLPRKYAIIPTGIDIEKFSENSKGSRNITFIGRLIDVKGADYLIKAFCKLDKKRNYKLIIVGDGPQRKELEKIACREVFFTGWRSDIPEILQATEIFVLPSLSEGLPVALLEALASGKACIVTDIGLPVKNYFNAIVVPPKDVESLQKAILKLINDKKLRKKLSHNARRSAEKFSWKKCIEEYEKLMS